MQCAISQLCGCCLISFFFIIIVVAVYSTITMFCFILFLFYFCFAFFFRWIFSIPCVCKSHEICTIYRYYANNVFTEHKLRFEFVFFFRELKKLAWKLNSITFNTKQCNCMYPILENLTFQLSSAQRTWDSVHLPRI